MCLLCNISRISGTESDEILLSRKQIQNNDLSVQHYQSAKDLDYIYNPRKQIYPNPKYVQCTPNTVLNLTRMGLKRIGDYFISSPDTRELYLDDNEITDISVNAFTSLKHLEILTLSGNNIPIDKMLRFKSHQTLRKLILDNNALDTDYGSSTSIENTSERFESLEDLSLRQNGISQFNIVMEDFAPYLNTLDFSGNMFESIDVVTFPKSIVYFSMDNNKLEKLDLKNLNDIEELSVSGNKFRELCGEDCSTNSWLSLKGMMKLSKLNVSHNQISIVQNDTFAYTKNLSTIDLSYNSIVSLAKNIFNKLTRLLELRMSHNLLITLPNTCPLNYMKYLDVSNNRIADVSCDSFCSQQYLRRIDLSNNYISFLKDDTFSKIQMLEWLDLSHNRINKLPAMLQNKMRYLRTLWLKNNSIDNIDDLFTIIPNAVVDLHLEENPLAKITYKNLILYLKQESSLDLEEVVPY